MDRTLERQFFAALKDVAASCMEWMSLTYDEPTGINEPALRHLVTSMNERRRIDLPSEVKEKFDSFLRLCGDEEHDIVGLIGGLMEEIDENLSSLPDTERESYVFSLITPFHGLASKREDYWPKLFSKIWDEESTEDKVKTLYMVAELYGGYLDAVLVKYGLDLLELQKQCGVALRKDRCIKTIAERLGSPELAKKYVKALPPRRDKQGFPKEIDTDKGRELIRKAQEAGFISCDNGKFKWGRTKVLLAYFAMKATEYLNLPSRETENGSTICLAPFEVLFQEKNLKASVNAARQRNGGDFLPNGYREVNTLFDSTE